MDSLIELLLKNGYECEFDDISSITFIVNVYDLGSDKMIVKHVDIDFTFGEYIEIQEEEKAYKDILDYFSVTDVNEEALQVLYQKK